MAPQTSPHRSSSGEDSDVDSVGSDTRYFVDFPHEFVQPRADSDWDSDVESLSESPPLEAFAGRDASPPPSPAHHDSPVSDFFGENFENLENSLLLPGPDLQRSVNVFDEHEFFPPLGEPDHPAAEAAFHVHPGFERPEVLSSSEEEDEDVEPDHAPSDPHDAGDNPPWLELFGLDARPHWWHYKDPDEILARLRGLHQDDFEPEHGDDAPAPPHEEAAVEAAEAADQDAPPPPENQDDNPLQPDYPDLGADSPTWAEYWTRRQRFDAWRAGIDQACQQSTPPSDEERERDPADSEPIDYPPQDFHAPGLVDGEWNRSAHVSSIAAHGFAIQPDITKRGKKPPPMRFKNKAEEAYVLQLIEDGILEKGDVQFCVPHFFLYKPGKLRLVFNGKRLNAACKTPPKFNMKSHSTIQRLAARHSWHAADDLKNHFFTTKIAEKSRPFFGFHTSLGTFRYTSLPFGFSWSPFIAHVCVDEIVKRAIEVGLKVTHYLDDFHYFGDSQQECERARDFVRNLLRAAGYRLNMSKEQPPGQVFTALGLLYDLNNKTVCAKPGFLAGLRSQHVLRLGSKHKVTRHEVASILGSFIFLNAAYPGSLAYLSALIAIVRSGGSDWALRYNYRRLAPYVLRVLEMFEKLPPMPLQVYSAEDPPVHLYTDASSKGLGLVFPDFTAAYGVPRPKTIYRLEADAAAWALQQDLPASFCLRIDNEALVRALLKGRSNIPEANFACALLFLCRLRGHCASAKWVSTKENPADTPSRLQLARSELFVSPVVCQC